MSIVEWSKARKLNGSITKNWRENKRSAFKWRRQAELQNADDLCTPRGHNERAKAFPNKVNLDRFVKLAQIGK